MEKRTNEVILAFIGEPSRPDSHFTSCCHGYEALVCSEHNAIYKLFDSLCMWSGATNTYIKGGDYYSFYELSCQDKDFFKSEYFKRICKPYNVTITIIEDGKELHEKFYSMARMRY